MPRCACPSPEPDNRRVNEEQDLLSSIIKALKRIEEQYAQMEDEPSRPANFRRQGFLKQRRPGYAALRRRLVIGLIFCLILVGAVLLIEQRKVFLGWIPASIFSTFVQPSQTVTTQLSTHHVYHGKITRSPAEVDKNPVEKLGASPQNKPSLPSQRQKADLQAEKKQSSMPPKQINRQPANNQTPGDENLKDTSVPQPARQQVAKAVTKQNSPSFRDPGRTVLPKENESGVDIFADLNPLIDPAIHLQAIAWSETAPERMAVINGRIVREGHSVDGFTIRQIRSDDVILNDGRQLWRLEFR